MGQQQPVHSETALVGADAIRQKIVEFQNKKNALLKEFLRQPVNHADKSSLWNDKRKGLERIDDAIAYLNTQLPGSAEEKS